MFISSFVLLSFTFECLGSKIVENVPVKKKVEYCIQIRCGFRLGIYFLKIPIYGTRFFLIPIYGTRFFKIPIYVTSTSPKRYRIVQKSVW